ncbi:MAG: VacJ family lipoprotein [Desulfuromonadales bacterium]|nr:VacJ family lipoprotein [Desulfuromonadales bacterium]
MLNIHKLVLSLTLVLLFGVCGETWAANDAGETKPDSLSATEQDWTQLDEDEEELVVWDPIEPFNRGVFWFNDKLYFYALKPVARGYRAVLPEPVRESTSNFFQNLATPVRVVNALLQFKGRKAADESINFVFNSTFGLAGLFDLKVVQPESADGEDFGQTLGHYGTSPGFYLVLPILGPSNARDAVGSVADSLTHPVSSPYYLQMKQLEIIGARVYQTVNHLSLDRDTYESIKKEALDPYLFVRNAYMQSRAARIDK